MTNKRGRPAHASPLPPPSTSSGARVLVVDDDEDHVTLLSFHLSKAGFRVEGIYSAADAVRSALRERPDVVVLDMRLSDGSGLDVLQAMRASRSLRRVGVLMLTAARDEHARITAFELGADDYVAKPFNIRELVLRVAALARRLTESTPEEQFGDVLRYGPLELDKPGHLVTVNRVPIALSPTEFDLLGALMAQPGRVLTRGFLLRAVWGASEDDYEQGSRTIDMHLQRLRNKLADAGRMISTVRGSGYRFDPPAESGTRDSGQELNATAG